METDMINIRPFEESDWAATWQVVEPVFRAGETYSFSPDITEDETYHQWIEIPAATFVAVDENNNIVGTYYVKKNQPGLGSHICNCGYIVSENARNQGIASQMCEHSQREALSLGFRAMQYNLVVSSNEGAVHLWKKHGFKVVGTIPEAFQHPRLGYVDAYVMYKKLAT